MQIYCKWASCRSQFDSVWLQSFILTQLSSTMIKNHCDLYSSFTCEKKSRHLYSVFSPLPFFLLSSMTQMLTTQADRFSAEEVHCSPPAHANYHHYNSFVSVGELNWKKKKIQGWTSSWRPPASTSDTFSCKKTKTPEWIILKPFLCTLGYGLCGDNIW